MRIVIRSPDARRARHLMERLEAGGLAASAMIGPSAWRAAPTGEDIALLDAAAAKEALALRQASSSALAIVAATTLAAPPDAPARDAFDGWIACDGPPEILSRRLTAIYRDAICAVEGVARARTSQALGLVGDDDADPEIAPAVMAVGGPTPVFLALERTFARCGARTAAALTSFSAFDHLHDDNYDALVINALDDPPTALSLVGALRRNARLYHLPCLLLAAEGDGDTRAAALGRGVEHICAPGQSPEHAVSWLMEDIRRNRARRRQRRSLFASALLNAPTLAFNMNAFHAHLDELARRHHECGRPLSVGIVRFTPPAPDIVDKEAWRRGFGEIVSLSARLVRASDSAAALDGETIAFAFPCTERDGARQAIDRVAAVCECTAFAAGDNGRNAPAIVRRSAELAPGESGAGLLARTIVKLSPRAITA